MATIGETFSEARARKGTSASEAAKATRMKVQHVEAMERDDFSGMAAPAYAKGFIKLYAEYLELDPDPLVREYLSKHVGGERPSLMGEQAKPRRSLDMAGKVKKAADSLSTVPREQWMRLGVGMVVVLIVIAILLALGGEAEESATTGQSEAREPATEAGSPGEAADWEILEEPPDPYIRTEDAS